MSDFRITMIWVAVYLMLGMQLGDAVVKIAEKYERNNACGDIQSG